METAVILFVVLLSSSWCRSSAILAPVDYLALQSVRKSLSNLPGSSFFARWDFTGNPCAFPGVFCSGNCVVALAGRLSPALGRLSTLAELSLVPGRIVGPIPPTSPSAAPFASSPSAATSSPALSPPPLAPSAASAPSTSASTSCPAQSLRRSPESLPSPTSSSATTASLAKSLHSPSPPLSSASISSANPSPARSPPFRRLSATSPSPPTAYPAESTASSPGSPGSTTSTSA